MNIAPTNNQEHFEFLLPRGQQWFSAKEVACLIGRTDQYVRDAFDNQKILGHLANAKARRGREKRRTYQIHREAIILFLLETANFRPHDFLTRLQEILTNRSPRQLSQVQQFVTGRLSHLDR
jgi:prophage antirepressor-like protein